MHYTYKMFSVALLGILGCADPLMNIASKLALEY